MSLTMKEKQTVTKQLALEYRRVECTESNTQLVNR